MQYFIKIMTIAGVIFVASFSGNFAYSNAQEQPEQPEQQDQVTSKPKPAGRALTAEGYPDQDPLGDQESTPTLRPDTRPLTGVQNPTLGSPQILHSYWVPGIQYGNKVSSVPLNRLAPVGWNSTSYIVGALSLLKVWTNAELSVNYSGGGILASYNQGNGSLHQFEVVQLFDWKRWKFVLLDKFSYLPESAITFAITTGISTPGVGGDLGYALSDLQNTYQPSQTIFDSFGPRYSNSFTPQGLYAISPRGSINLAGSYGILRFTEPGNIDSNDGILNVGYNYALTKNDAIGVLYRFAAFRYIGNPQALNNHSVLAAYHHRITGRLALQLFVGPQLTTFRVPLEGVTHALGPSAGVTFSYARGSNNLSLAYTHAVNGGSGILLGANVDELQATLMRRLTRRWSGGVNVGYALNRRVIESGPGQSSPVYNLYYVGAGLRRSFYRDSTFYVTYVGNFHTGQSVCVSCSANHTEHDITVGFSWHATPFVIR
jgi:hypothetical protein